MITTSMKPVKYPRSDFDRTALDGVEAAECRPDAAGRAAAHADALQRVREQLGHLYRGAYQ